MKILCAALTLSLLPGLALAEVPAPLTCLLAPARSSNIGTDLRGVVADVAVSRTDRVTAGQALVTLDTAVARASRDLAQVTVDGLAERLERGGTLAARNLISRDEINQLTTELGVARAELARAELEIARATIRAPFAGIIANVGIVEGELSGTDTLATLIDVDRLHAEMVFVDGAFNTFEVGEPVRLALDLTGDQVMGEVLRIDPFIDPTSNSFSAVAVIDNSDGTLPAGVNCRVLGTNE